MQDSLPERRSLYEAMALPIGSWVGHDVKNARLVMRLSQEQFAHEIGYTRQGVYKIEQSVESIEKVVERAVRHMVLQRAPEDDLPKLISRIL